MTDDHRKRAKGISNDDGMVASRWRLDSYVGMRGAVDPLVTPVDMEKAGCCGSLAYGPMAKMDAGSGGDGTSWAQRIGQDGARAQELRLATGVHLDVQVLAVLR
jgi:hypothetical protein